MAGDLDEHRWSGTPRLLTGIGRTLAAERDRWPLWFPVALGIGIAVYFSLPFEPPLWLGPAGLGLIIAGATLTRWQTEAPTPLFPLMLLFIAVALGFTAAQVRTITVAPTVLTTKSGPLWIEARVARVQLRSDGLRLILSDMQSSNDEGAPMPERVRIRFRGDQPTVEAGDRIRARAVLLPPPAPAAPGAYDFQRQAFFAGLGAVGYALGPLMVVEHDDHAFQNLIGRVRALLQNRINASLEGSTAALATALLTGERGAIDPAVMAAIRDSGLAHLLAISGLHIGLVAGVLFVGTRSLLALIAPLALRAPIKKWAAVVAILGAGGYALLAGATVPTQRAFLMIALVFIGVLLDRRGLSMRMVAWAATVILLLTPESLLTASFQLSFAAVTALIAVYETVSAHRSLKGNAQRLPRRAGGYLAGVALTTVAASFATAPFVIHHFSRVAAFGLAANIIAVPITALWVMPLAVVAVMLMPFGLESLALVPMSWGLEAVTAVATAVAGWPGAVTFLAPLPNWGIAAVTFGGLWLCLWRRPWRWLGTAGLAAGLVSAATTAPPDILIDDQGELMAVRTAAGGLAVSVLRSGRFRRELWTVRHGRGYDPELWPEGTFSRDGRLACDPLGCLYRARGQVVAFIRRPEAALEDCALADLIVVTMVRLPPQCARGPIVIDHFDLKRGGVHAVWLTPEAVRIETVNGLRGQRPWVLRDMPSPRRPRTGSAERSADMRPVLGGERSVGTLGGRVSAPLGINSGELIPLGGPAPTPGQVRKCASRRPHSPAPARPNGRAAECA